MREIVLLECEMCGGEELAGENTEDEGCCPFCGSAAQSIVVYAAREQLRQKWDGD